MADLEHRAGSPLFPRVRRLCHPHVKNGPHCFDIFSYQPAHTDREGWHLINLTVPKKTSIKSPSSVKGTFHLSHVCSYFVCLSIQTLTPLILSENIIAFA